VAGPRVVDLAGRHRALLDRSIRVGASIAFVATTLVAIFVRDGDWPAQRFLLVYFAPMLAYGAAWARDRLAHIDQVAPVLSAVDAFAFAAGALRAAGGWGILPYSGHMLFLSYAAAAPGPRPLRVIALALIAMTSYFKLVLWHDARTWSLGLVAGLTLAALRAILARRVHAAAPVVEPLHEATHHRLPP
jgi:hypothetical protein